MIVILNPLYSTTSKEYEFTLDALRALPNIEVKTHVTSGESETITEAYLIGDTAHVSIESIEALPAVKRAIRISTEYKLLGSHPTTEGFSFDYNGVTFSQDTFHLFAGLCAVDNEENVRATFKALNQAGLVCARMGVYKPRTSPYSFQGLGQDCLNYVFSAASEYNIKVIAMEVTHESQIEEIQYALNKTQSSTGVMLQIGTRNAQNFELLRAVGKQTEFPVLFKRGFGISLHESLLAAEYLANAGNHNIIFCLRGVKSLFGSPHRNLVDVAHTPVIKRMTRLPVGFDPSHSVGSLSKGRDGISDIYHVSAQAIISGANMLLTDIHPNPPSAVVDSRQAISLQDLPWYLEDIQLVRETYLKRIELAKTLNQR